MNAGASTERPAIEVLHLRKSYGTTVAVDDVSFSVDEGEIFGILGPNGAGKTTTIECVIGLRSPGSGSVRVMGLDPGEDSEQLHLIVGAQLQASAASLTQGRRDPRPLPVYRQPADVAELVRVLGLAGKLTNCVLLPVDVLRRVVLPRAEMPRDRLPPLHPLGLESDLPVPPPSRPGNSAAAAGVASAPLGRGQDVAQVRQRSGERGSHGCVAAGQRASNAPIARRRLILY
jgi:ABC transporter